MCVWYWWCEHRKLNRRPPSFVVRKCVCAPAYHTHKALRSMIYELGKELQTTDFPDEHAIEEMISSLKRDLASASSALLPVLVGRGSRSNRVHIPLIIVIS